MKKGFWAKWFLPMLAVTLVIALVVSGCAKPAPPEKEVLPPKVKLIEVSKVEQTEFSADSFRGMKYVGLIAENEALFLAVAEAVTTAIDPVIDAVVAGKATPDDIFGAAMGAAMAKGEEVGIERAQREGIAGATAGAATKALAGGAAAAKGAAAGASVGVAKGMAEVSTVIAVNMAAAQGRSVTVELAFEIKNPNDFQIEVGYQWYYISVAGRQIGRVMYPEKMYIPANTAVIVRHRDCIRLLDDIILPSLPPPLALPIHGATLQPPAPGTGAIETGMEIWSKIRIPYEAEKAKNVDSWNREVGMKTAPLTADQISEYIGAVYLGGKYVSGTRFEEAYDTAATVTWDVKCELGVHSEYGSVTEVSELSWTAGS